MPLCAVVLEMTLPNGIEQVRRCNCSLCARKGAVMASVPLSGLRVVEGADRLRLYQWNTKVVEHYFCGTCGIYTHHRRRSNPSEYVYNLACVDGIDIAAHRDVPIGDGAAMSLIEEQRDGP